MRYPAHVAVGDHPDVLRRILEPGINLAIWERRLHPVLQRWLDGLTFGRMPHGDCSGHISRSLGDELRAKLLIGEGEALGYALLARDLESCATLFADIKEDTCIGLQLRRHRFGHPRRGIHPDGTNYRLVTTYRGRGMLWLPNDQVTWDGELPARDDRNRVIWHGKMREVPRGAVAIIRGTEATGTKPLIHVSPFMEKDDPDRFLALLH